MRHQLRNPAYPDLVEAWAIEDRALAGCQSLACVNDNEADGLTELSDPLLDLLARIDIAETRVW